jgi:hypothetical protein
LNTERPPEHEGNKCNTTSGKQREPTWSMRVHLVHRYSSLLRALDYEVAANLRSPMGNIGISKKNFNLRTKEKMGKKKDNLFKYLHRTTKSHCRVDITDSHRLAMLEDFSYDGDTLHRT